jgi:hypothetical protein
MVKVMLNKQEGYEVEMQAMEAFPPFAISKGMATTPLWVALREHMETRLEQLRRKNEGDQDERATASLRGRILEIRAFLALEEQDKPKHTPL